MVVEDYYRVNPRQLNRPVEILATDVSTRVLREARRARYCGMTIERGLTLEQKQRYFIPDQNCLEVHPKIRSRVQFRELNLTQSFDALGRFDVIFCRNVLIYFSNDLKGEILNRLTASLNPFGYLVLGSTESINQFSDQYKMQVTAGSIVYRLKS
jgi:chemotaxis protein methyltransferase CheR